MPRTGWINQLLVHGPDLIPLLIGDVLAGSLANDELLESLNLEASSEDTLDRGHARVVPALHSLCVDKPGELALAEAGVDKVQPAEEKRVECVRKEKKMRDKREPGGRSNEALRLRLSRRDISLYRHQ